MRPHLEYANPVWSVHLRKHVKLLENVQIRATKQVDGMKHMEYTERLQKLNLPTLEYRRKRGDMIQVWNHFNKYEKSTISSNFRLNPRTNRKHPFQLTWNRPKDGVHGVQANSFYFRIASEWNELPEDVPLSETINTFKSRLDDAWIDHPSKFTIDQPQTCERFIETV